MEQEDPWMRTGEELKAEIMRADHAFGVDLWGTARRSSMT